MSSLNSNIYGKSGIGGFSGSFGISGSLGSSYNYNISPIKHRTISDLELKYGNKFIIKMVIPIIPQKFYYKIVDLLNNKSYKIKIIDEWITYDDLLDLIENKISDIMKIRRNNQINKILN
jgi:hypothetical protein